MIILERVTVILTLYESLDKNDDFEEIFTNLSHLIQYVHHNILVLLELIAEKYPFEQDSKLEQRVKQVIKAKRIRTQKKNDRPGFIKKNNDIVLSILKLMYPFPD